MAELTSPASHISGQDAGIVSTKNVFRSYLRSVLVTNSTNLTNSINSTISYSLECDNHHII